MVYSVVSVTTLPYTANVFQTGPVPHAKHVRDTLLQNVSHLNEITFSALCTPPCSKGSTCSAITSPHQCIQAAHGMESPSPTAAAHAPGKKTTLPIMFFFSNTHLTHYILCFPQRPLVLPGCLFHPHQEAFQVLVIRTTLHQTALHVRTSSTWA